MFKKILVKSYQKGYHFATKYRISWKLLKVLNNLLIKHLKFDSVELDGHKLFLDANDPLRFSFRGLYEPYIMELMQKEVKKGDLVVDIGAYLGSHTLHLARLVGKNGLVYAFEPHPGNFALLKKNVEANGYKNVVLEPKAVAEKSGKVKLYFGKEEKNVHSSLMKNEFTQEQFIEVDSVALDDYFGNKEKVHLIKMDLEGAEHQAILGMRNLLTRNKDIKLISEFTPVYLKKLGVTPEEHLNLLKELGFQIMNINEKDQVLDRLKLDRLETHFATRFGGSINSINTNIFCWKQQIKDPTTN